MTRRMYWGCLLGFSMSLMAGTVLADNTSAATSDQSNVARLEALLSAQQRQIESLEQQVAAAQLASTDQVRAAQIKAQLRDVLSQQEFREELMPPDAAGRLRQRLLHSQ